MDLKSLLTVLFGVESSVSNVECPRGHSVHRTLKWRRQTVNTEQFRYLWGIPEAFLCGYFTNPPNKSSDSYICCVFLFLVLLKIEFGFVVFKLFIKVVSSKLFQQHDRADLSIIVG